MLMARERLRVEGLANRADECCKEYCKMKRKMAVVVVAVSFVLVGFGIAAAQTSANGPEGTNLVLYCVGGEWIAGRSR
jgi:hypothetical protein